MNTKTTDLEPVTGSTELAPLADFKNDVDISDINVPSIRLQHALADYVRKGLAKEGDRRDIYVTDINIILEIS